MARNELSTVLAVGSRALAVLFFTTLFGATDCQTFTVHPHNVTTLYDRTVSFTCQFTTATSPPQWRVVADGPSGVTLTLTFPTTLGVYSYHTATTTYAEVSVRADRNNPGLNDTCLTCRFITAGVVESGKGCLIIAAPPLKPFVSIAAIQFSSISLEWEEPWSHYPIHNYTVELQNSEGVQLSTRSVQRGSETYTVSGLTGDTRYRFRLRANSEAGNGEWSDAITEETLSSETLPIELIGIITGCVIAVVVVVVVIIVVVSFVCYW